MRTAKMAGIKDQRPAASEARPSADGCATHEVLNQPPPLDGYNLFSADAALRAAVSREGAAWAEQAITALGERAGRPEIITGRFRCHRSDMLGPGNLGCWRQKQPMLQLKLAYLTL